MDDFVRKPYRSNEIYECLSKHLGVRYIYEGIPESREQAVLLVPEMLAVLPEALRNELKDALESLEGERIALAVRQVGAYDKKLQEALDRLAGNFDYPAILRALRTN
jgi:hypothetical protein